MNPPVRLDVPGRQHGVVRFARRPTSTRADVADWVDPWTAAELPVCVIGRGDGPVVAIVGTGDAVAQHAIAGLCREIDTDRLRGSVRLIPSLRPPGELAARSTGAATAPFALPDLGVRPALDAWLDGADLVMELGDVAAGGPTSWRWCDVASIEVAGLDRAAERRGGAAAEAALIAFGAPLSVRQRRACPRSAPRAPDVDLGCPSGSRPATADALPPPAAGLLAARCRELGVDWLGTRGHRSPGLGADALAIGCRNVLVQSGVLDEPFTLRASRQLLLDVSRDLQRSPASGVLEMRTRPGAEVVLGDEIARLLDAEAPQRPPRSLRAVRSGCVAAVRHDGPVAPGDGIVIVADEMQG